MRNLFKLGVVAIITMAFWNPGTTLSAQGLPSGSYQQTCRNIGINGSRLHATCKDGSGNWQSTELSDYQNCSNEITNDNGALRCNSSTGYSNGGYNNGNRDRDNDRNSGQGYGQNGGPGGSYAQTCRNIRTQGNTLEADCQTGSGQWNRTSLRGYNRCNGGVVNDLGTLRCASDVSGYNNGGYNNGNRDRDNDGDRDHGQGGYQGGYQNGLPGGSYTQTCQDIHVSGNTLKANCQRGNGRLKQTSLQNFSQCSDIANDNGRLRCNR